MLKVKPSKRAKHPQHARLNGAGKRFQFAVGVFLDELTQLQAWLIPASSVPGN